MARPAQTPEQRRTARRGIQRAAAELATESGAASVTVRNVAARAGVSVGTVYSHFDGLAELMRSLWTPVVDEANVKLAAVVDAHPEPVARIAAVLGHFVELALGQPAFHRSTLLFVRPANSPAPEQRPADELDFHRALADAIRAGQLDGAIVDGDPAILAQLLWAGVHGALALPVNTDIYELRPAEDQARLMIDTLLGAIRAN